MAEAGSKGSELQVKTGVFGTIDGRLTDLTKSAINGSIGLACFDGAMNPCRIFFECCECGRFDRGSEDLEQGEEPKLFQIVHLP